MLGKGPYHCPVDSSRRELLGGGGEQKSSICGEKKIPTRIFSRFGSKEGPGKHQPPQERHHWGGEGASAVVAETTPLSPSGDRLSSCGTVQECECECVTILMGLSLTLGTAAKETSTKYSPHFPSTSSSTTSLTGRSEQHPVVLLSVCVCVFGCDVSLQGFLRGLPHTASTPAAHPCPPPVLSRRGPRGGSPGTASCTRGLLAKTPPAWHGQRPTGGRGAWPLQPTSGGPSGRLRRAGQEAAAGGCQRRGVPGLLLTPGDTRGAWRMM